jgi:hypothetical protein
MSAVLKFGKHEGKTLVETVFSDPAWFVWATAHGIFHDRGGPSLQAEAEEIWLKARNIRMPQGHSDGSQVAYYYQGWNQNFLGLSIVADGRFEEHADLKDILDLGYVCESGRKDRAGNQILITAIKRLLFGEKTRVTVEMMEQFFANPDNFDLPAQMQQAAE